MDRIYVMELVRSFQVGQLSRREFLKRSAAAAGSMAAANMLLAACAEFPNLNPSPVVDNSQSQRATRLKNAAGLATAMVEYPAAAGETLLGYLAYQPGDEPKPAVIVIQEWWGVNDHIKDVANRFAQEGFVALAPDLYHGQVATEPDEARKLVMELSMPAAVKEIQQAVLYLQAQDFVGSNKVGLVGYCMGGGLVLQTALVEDDLAGGVVYYGSPLAPADAARVKTPILTFIGTQDNISVSGIKAMHQALDQAGIPNEFQIYEGAQHAFFNDTRPSYNEIAAADAWPRTLAWFRQHGGAT